MKKSISIVLCLVMLFSIFSVCGAAVNTADANDVMYVESSGFESGKITYTVYLKKNLNVTGAILRIKYDPAVLEPVKYLPADSSDAEYNDGCFFENDGAYVETDEYGDVTYPVPGVYVSGMFEDSDDTCSVGFVNMEGSDTGSTDKPFMSFKFNVVSSNRPITAVEFYCDEFTCSDENLNIPKSDDPQLFYTHETSTLDKIKFGSVYFLDEGLKFEWEESTGAAGYRVCKEIDGEMIGIADVPATQTYYIDETAEPFCISTYTVRALDADGNLDSGLSGNISVFYNKPHDHIYSDWITDKEETCTEDGSKHIECTLCKEVFETGVLPATGHTIVKDDAVPATCTTDGKTEGSHCSVCNEEINAQIVVPANGHVLSGWIIIKNPTYYAAGQKYKECSNCDYTYVSVIPQLKCSKPKLKTIANTATGVKLTWGKVKGADSYEVYRKVKGGSYSKVGTTSKAYFTDKKAKSGKQYYYVVKAVNEAGESAGSNYKTIRYLADPTLKTPTSAKKGITLKWSKVTGAQGYMVYRKTGNGSYSKITTVKGVSKVSYVDKKTKKGKKYTYKVKAYYGKTYSAYSKTKTIKDKY